MDWTFDLHPRVVVMRIKRACDLHGEWQDDEHVFTYIASGSAEFLVSGERFQLKTGDVIVLPPYAPHTIASRSDEPLVQYIFHFTTGGADGTESPWGSRVAAVTLTDAERYDMRNAYLRMYKEYSERRPGYQAALTGLALTMLVPYLRGMDEQLAPAATERKDKAWIHIEKAVEYINKHLQNDELANEEIAAAIHVSANYLTKLFQEHLGFSLHAYVLNQRVEKAKSLLYGEPISITEVAYRCGFSGIHVFSKTFKRIVGMTPSEFLESSVLKGALYPTDSRKA